MRQRIKTDKADGQQISTDEAGGQRIKTDKADGQQISTDEAGGQRIWRWMGSEFESG